MADEKTFDFLNKNEREPKPRKTGITEIRGPYYAVMGKRYLLVLWKRWANMWIH